MTDTAAVPERPSIFSADYRAATVATFAAIALLAFEGTAVIAALPELGEQLGDVRLLPWVITGFLLASGIATVASGPIIDAVGVRAVFLASAIGMAVTGLAAGLATSMGVLVALRIVQGLTAGGLITATNAGVNVTYPRELTAIVFAGNSTVWGVMGAAAPAMASVMLAYLSWRWLFYITLPIGLAAAFLARGSMPSAQPGAARHRLDVIGLTLVGVFSVASVLAIAEINARSLPLLVLAAVALAGFVWWSRRVGERAVMRLVDFARQPFSGIGMTPTLQLAGAFCAHLYLTVYLTAVRGYSQSAAAWSVLWFTVGWTFGSILSARIIDLRGSLGVMTLGWAASGAGLAGALAGVALGWTPWFVFVAMGVVGVGAGLTTNASLVAIRSAAEASEMGRKAGAHYFLRGQGFTMGSAIGGSALLYVVTAQVGDAEPVRELLSETGGTVELPPGFTADELAGLVADGYALAIAIGLVLSLAAYLPLRSLKRSGL